MVTDDHVALMRAMLLGEVETYVQLKQHVQAGDPQAVKGLELLLNAAFDRAVRDRFGRGTTRRDVIRLVARARTADALRMEQVDPRVAEQLIIGYLQGDADAVQGLDPNEASLAMAGLLAEMVSVPPDEQAIDAFLAEARSVADQMSQAG